MGTRIYGEEVLRTTPPTVFQIAGIMDLNTVATVKNGFERRHSLEFNGMENGPGVLEWTVHGLFRVCIVYNKSELVLSFVSPLCFNTLPTPVEETVIWLKGAKGTVSYLISKLEPGEDFDEATVQRGLDIIVEKAGEIIPPG